MRGRMRLVTVPLALSALVATLLVAGAAPAHAAPANDAFSAAQTIIGMKGVTYGTLVGATIETGTTCGEPAKSNQPGDYGDRSVWYRWAAPANGTLRFGIKTYGGWTGYIAAYRYYGGCVRHLETGASSTPGHIGSLEVWRGETIWFGVYSYGAANVGSFALGWRLIPTPPPLNDAFANADVVWGQYGKANGSNINATREAGEPAHAGRAGGHSVWFRWTAVRSGPAMFHVGGPATPLDCLLAVYTGTAVSALTRVAADSGTWAGNSCTARFTATAGVPYRVAVDGDGGDEMTFQLFWNSGPPPSHDDAADARQLTGFAGVLDDTNRGATDELTEPRYGPKRVGSSVWYRWTAPDDGNAVFQIYSPYLYQPRVVWEDDKRIAVFTGTPPAGLTLRADSSNAPADDGPIAYLNGVTRGTTFWIQVTGADEQVVHYVLYWRLRPESNDEFAEPVVLPATGSTAVLTEGATAEPGEPAHGRYPARRSLWFSWTAPQSGRVTFDDWEEGDGYFAQPVIAAYTGNRLDALTRVPVTHEFMTPEWNTFSFPVTAGITYRVALDEDDPFAHGERHRLNWYFGTREWTDPAVTLRSPAPGARVSGVALLSADASDDSGVWSVRFSHHSPDGRFTGQRSVSFSAGLDTERYADGPFELTATASDVQANSATTAPRTVVVENRPPAVISWFNPPEKLTFDTNAHLEWGTNEPITRSLCSLDGAPYTDCGVLGDRYGSRDYAGLADGVHVFRVIVTDTVGKIAVDADAYQWIIDTKGLGVLLPDDASAPTVTAPAPDITSGQPVGTTTAPVRMRWTSSDGTGTGIQRHDVQRSVDGGAWTAVTSYGALTAQIYQLAAGHTYRFRVRAWDWAGNVSAWAYGPTFAVSLAQETSTAWRWSTGWTRPAWTNASAGYVKLTSTRGAYGRLTFRGRSVALYGPRASSLGLSAIYLDGVRVATVNQWSSTAVARQPLYIRNGLGLATTHVLEVRSLGTAGHTGGGTRVAVDVASIVR
jgi:hypothetical protein